MKLDIDYINGLKSEIDELNQQATSKKFLIRREIAEVNGYLSQLKELEVFECGECGREIAYEEFNENDGLCNVCGGY